MNYKIPPFKFARQGLSLLFFILLSCVSGFSQSANLSVTQDDNYTGKGNDNEVILKANFNVSTTRTLNNIGFTLSGTTDIADIDEIKIYWTGSTNDFDSRNPSATLLATVSPSSSTIIATINHSISSGNNYVWITAKISENAVEGNIVDGTIESYRLNNNDNTVNSSTGNPSGSRQILLKRKLLFAPGDNGSQNYRIPAITTAADGSLVALTDKRKYGDGDLPGDIDILSSRSNDGGETWSSPLTIAQGTGQGQGFGDALIFKASSGKLVALYVGGPGLWTSTSNNPIRHYEAHSDDNGVTWSAPRDITSQIFGVGCSDPVRRNWLASFFGSGHGLTLKDGRLIGVIAVREGSPTTLNNYAVYSDDEGVTWNVSSRAIVQGDEAKVVELNNGDILMSARGNTRIGSVSSNRGQTWGNQYLMNDLTGKPTNGDMVRYSSTADGDAENIILHTIPNSADRKRVTMYASFDEGSSWQETKVLQFDNSAYSSVTVLDDGTIGVYLEEDPFNDEVFYDMYYLNFSLEWLLDREPPVDSDGDGMNNSIDNDDDNDGILDSVERNCVTTSVSPDNIQPDSSSSSVDNASNISSSDNNYASLNANSDMLVVDLGAELPAQAVIKIEARVSYVGNSSPNRMILASKKNASDSWSTTETISFSSTNDENKTYSLPSEARYIRIQAQNLAAQYNDLLRVDHVTFDPVNTQICDEDVDNDGIPNALDLDSDNDGTTDIIEAGLSDADGNGMVDTQGETAGSGLPNEDGDTLPDFIDPPTNSSLPSTIDGNGDGVIDDATDADEDGIPDIFDGSNGFESGPLTDYGDFMITDYFVLGAINYRDWSAPSNIPDEVQSIWLGNSEAGNEDGDISYESVPSQSSSADVDAYDDGLVITTKAPNTGTGRTETWTVTVNSNSAGNEVFFKIYIDWDPETNKGFDAEYTGSGITGSPTEVPVTISVPDSYNGGLVNARIVAASSAADAEKTSGLFFNGEIEDYQFTSGQILPVKLEYFTADSSGTDAELTWKTASEVQNSHFDIEYSFDGINFTTLTQVESLADGGNSSTALFYSYTHSNAAHFQNVFNEIVYYRLKQVDLDGSSDYSEVKAVSFDNDHNQSKLYPNPVGKGQEVLVQGNDIKTIKIYTTDGNLVKQIENSSNQTVSFTTTGMENGIYIVVIDNSHTHKLIVY